MSCASSGALPTVGCELLKFHAKADMIMDFYFEGAGIKPE
jgi:hypothetical protein